MVYGIVNLAYGQECRFMRVFVLVIGGEEVVDGGMGKGLSLRVIIRLPKQHGPSAPYALITRYTIICCS